VNGPTAAPGRQFRLVATSGTVPVVTCALCACLVVTEHGGEAAHARMHQVALGGGDSAAAAEIRAARRGASATVETVVLAIVTLMLVVGAITFAVLMLG